MKARKIEGKRNEKGEKENRKEKKIRENRSEK